MTLLPLTQPSIDYFTGNGVAPPARAELPFPDYLEVVSAPDAADTALATLTAAAALIDAHATQEDAASTKQWLLEVAGVAAQAGKEDQGFLGRGGVLINDKERAALARVAAALGLAG